MSEKTSHKATSVGYDSKLPGLEKWVDETFNTKNPVKLPEGARSWFANNLWWLAIVGGVLGIISVFQAWQLVNYANTFSSTYGYLVTRSIGTTFYVSLAISLVESIILLVASPQLRAHKKSGWNLVFYVSLISIALGIFYALTPQYGAGGLIGALIGVAISWTILSQIRSHFAK